VKRITKKEIDAEMLIAAGEMLCGSTSTVRKPAESVADASKILVKIYPGVFSQVLEGTEGMLRLPGG